VYFFSLLVLRAKKTKKTLSNKIPSRDGAKDFIPVWMPKGIAPLVRKVHISAALSVHYTNPAGHYLSGLILAPGRCR
jgi:hypothetical protein